MHGLVDSAAGIGWQMALAALRREEPLMSHGCLGAGPVTAVVACSPLAGSGIQGRTPQAEPRHVEPQAHAPQKMRPHSPLPAVFPTRYSTPALQRQPHTSARK